MTLNFVQTTNEITQNLLWSIDKQKTLRRDSFYNIEKTVLEIGVSGDYLHVL